MAGWVDAYGQTLWPDAYGQTHKVKLIIWFSEENFTDQKLLQIITSQYILKLIKC